jgi:hypothetical protein
MIANTGSDDALILPHRANPAGLNFRERQHKPLFVPDHVRSQSEPERRNPRRRILWASNCKYGLNLWIFPAGKPGHKAAAAPWPAAARTHFPPPPQGRSPSASATGTYNASVRALALKRRFEGQSGPRLSDGVRSALFPFRLKGSLEPTSARRSGSPSPPFRQIRR